MSKEKIRGILVFENPKKYTMTTKAKGGIIKKYSSGGAAKRGYGKARN
jgi:hypothetical protein